MGYCGILSVLISHINCHALILCKSLKRGKVILLSLTIMATLLMPTDTDHSYFVV